MSCINCGSPFHEIWDCPKPKLDRGKLKAVEPDDISKPPSRSNASVELIVGRRRGRPQTITDMKAYRAQKAKERRAKLKDGK